MNCNETHIFINQALDGRLPQQYRQDLERHLSECADCAAAYAEYSRLDALLKEHIAEVEPPVGFTASVMSALDRQPVVMPVARPRRRIGRWIATAAIAAALLAATALSGLFSPEEAPPLTPAPPIAEQLEPQPEPQQPIAPPVIEPEPVVAEEPDPEPQPEPPVIAEEPDPEPEPQPQPQTYNNGVPLPPVASGNISQGEYALYTLASYADYDALLPRINEQTVTYYVNADGIYLEYQVLVDGSAEPVFVGETESLPTAAAIAKFSVETAEDGSQQLVALSPDGLSRAINASGAAVGLYLQPVAAAEDEAEVEAEAQTPPEQVNSLGGGALLSFAPDGNKILFTDAAGNLHLYYIAEGFTLMLYNNPTHSAYWAADSQTLVFSAFDPASGFNSIFRVSVP